MLKTLIFLYSVNLFNFILVAEENPKHPPITKQDKKYYEGEWKNDKAHGKGIYIFPDGGKYKKYTGEWKNGEFHGQGKLTYTDGREYIGQFKNGLKNGDGTLILSDGQKYVGEFKDDKAEGYGTTYNTKTNTRVNLKMDN